MRSQNFRYIIIPMLMFLFILIFAFQNCSKSEDSSVRHTRASTGGDNAVFKLSEKHNGGDDVSEILWQIKSGTGCGTGTISTETALNIEIPWNQDYEPGTWGIFNVAALTHLEQEDCFIYHSFRFSDVLSVDHLSCALSSGFISFSLSDDSSIERNYFPVGSSVNLEVKEYESSIEESLENISFQWSIKKVGDDTELADSSHTSHQLTHTFSEMGLYEVSIKPTSPSENLFGSFDGTDLFIGLCEKEVEAVEVVLSEESFGNLTPEEALETRPIFNYVRPSDTDSSNKVTLIFDDSRERYSGHSPRIYKYNRSSSSKFIDIDIQNADECFFDDEPILKECSQPPIDCVYEIREGLSPLSSCSGKALDMSTLDTDTTECTDDIFFVVASQTGQEYKPQKTFYKHCPADQDYCYFGEENYYRPSDHNCPSS